MLPLRTRVDCARGIALAVGRRYLPMVSVLCRQERDRRLLDQAYAAEECVASRAHVNGEGVWSEGGAGELLWVAGCAVLLGRVLCCMRFDAQSERCLAHRRR